MTIETATGDLGQTFYLLHPPGLSIRDSDNTPEVVNKANPLTAFAAGAMLQVSANTAAGETWVAYDNSPNANRRYGHAASASGSGTATVSIIRHKRIVIPSYTGPTKTYLPNASVPFTSGTIAGKGVHTIPSSIVKPSAENWTAGVAIYGWHDGITTGYTNSVVTANSKTKSWYAGFILRNFGVGVTTALIQESFIHDATVAASYAQWPISFAEKLSLLSVTLTQAVFPYVDPARSSVVGTNTSASGTIRYGYLHGRDSSGPSYTYFPGENGGTAQTQSAFFGLSPHSVCFAQHVPVVWPDQNGRTPTPGSSNYVPMNDWVCILGRFDSPTSQYSRTTLMVPRIICGGTPAIDLALDTTLASPWTDLRVVWVGVVGSLVPATTKRTDPVTAPVTGMFRSNVLRPPYATGIRYDQQGQSRYAFDPVGSIVYGYGVWETYIVDMYLSGHPNVPYVWNRAVLNRESWNGTTETRARIGDSPSNTRMYWSSSYGIQWRWARWDYATGALVGVTSYAAALVSGAVQYADIPPAPLVDGDVHKLFLQVNQTGGGSVVNAIVDGPGAPGQFSWWIETHDGDGYGIYPYDVMLAPGLVNDADSTWVGHAGWRWAEPVISPPTWGAPSAVSYNSGTDVLTVANNPTCTRTATTHVDTPFQNATQRSVRAIVDDMTANWFATTGFYSAWAWNVSPQSNTFNGTTALVDKPAAASKTFNIELLFTAQAYSSYGMLMFPRWDFISVTIP